MKKTFNFSGSISGTSLVFIVIILSSIIIILHTVNHKSEPGVIYLSDYAAAHKASREEAVHKAYNMLLHRIWIDNPSYVEDVLNESDEFITLDSVIIETEYGWTNVFSYNCETDSLEYIQKAKEECEQEGW